MRMRPKGALGAAVAVVVGAAGLSAAPEQSAATFRGHPGAIAFSRAPAGGDRADIWIFRNGQQRRLTTSRKASETEPAFSRDGKLIVFARRAGGNSDLWVMRANGKAEHRVTQTSVDEFNPSFFPSGRSIVYERFGDDGFEVMTVRINGTRLKRAAADASDPAISADGEMLAFSRHRDRIGGIRLRNLRTGRTRMLTTGSAQELDFAPNGRRIVFTGQRRCSRAGGKLRFGLLSVRVSSGDVDRLRVECGREWIEPSWAPNGKRIVAVRKKLARTGPALRFRLAMLTPGGRLIDGEPRHRRGTNEMFPAWQPIRR